MEYPPHTVSDRKDQIEQVLAQALVARSSPEESALAWKRLCRELEFMTEPEEQMPRFARLLRAVWVAATNEQS